jgi:solute carrier family 13 (sodium-dependent dicarboxylate transporter), member 2/3/5
MTEPTLNKIKSGLRLLLKSAGFIGTYPARKITDAISFIGEQSKLNQFAPPLTKRELATFLTALIPAVLVSWYLMENSSLSSPASFMAGIFVLACLLWATEALPLFATALLIIGLEIIFIAKPFSNQIQDIDYTYFLKPLSDPIIILFLGGFILARASVKAGVDGLIASRLLRPFSASPSRMLMGIIIITSCFSMWMSNTATTAMMLSLLLPVFNQLKERPLIAKGLVLAVPIAANLGGMGTPVASPPNAFAIAYLANIGFRFNFGEWVLVAVPVMILMLLITWWLIKRFYLTDAHGIQFSIESNAPGNWANYVMFIFVITVLLWLSEGLHGIPAPVISLLPLIAFTSTGLITRNDINSMEWSILLLIAGGIALGMGMSYTGLDQVIAGRLKAGGLMLIPVMILSMILLSNFMSNTAAANLLIPIGISLMQSHEFSALGLLSGTVSIALASSMAMALPVSTPPNALAYSSGRIDASDFRKVGIRLGFIGMVLLSLLFALAGTAQRLGFF